MLENGVRATDRSGLRLIRPPAPGAKRFPVRPAPAAVAPESRPGPRAIRARRATEHAWFWTEVSPLAAAGSPRRWNAALSALRRYRASQGPLYRPEGIQRLADAWSGVIAPAAARHGVSEALLLAMIAVESAGKPRARSHKGAEGLMQLIPATARRFGVRDSFDPGENVRGGAAYMDWLLDRFGGDVILALAGYNAGEGAVDKHKGVPPYRETRAYVVKVLDALVAAEGLCPERPAGPRARCAWAGAGEGPQRDRAG